MVATVLLGALAATGCVQVKSAEVPEPPWSADPAARQAFYEQFKLTSDIGVFSATWKRRDGTYSFGALDRVAKQFSESEHVYESTKTRATALGFPASVGGGLIGVTLGWNLAASDSLRMSSTVQTSRGLRKVVQVVVKLP